MLLTDTQLRLIRTIFERGAESASQALSRWLGREAHLSISEVEQLDLTEAGGVLGSPETLVAACSMGLNGPLSGQILLIFEDRSGLALVDMLMRLPQGTTTSWGELEQSAARETVNIVGCAYVNALASHLPSTLAASRSGSVSGSGSGSELIPTPPTFFHEFAGSLVEFAVMDQALELDSVLMVHTAFSLGDSSDGLNWTLLFIPDRASLQALSLALSEPGHR